MKYYIPDSFDIDFFITRIPTSSIKPFKKKHLLYILDLITSIPANNKALDLKEGFVPINAKILQNKVRNYKQYLEYLVTSGVLIVNKHYIPGEKSRGYKFIEQFSGIVRMVIDDDENNTQELSKQLNGISKLHRKQYQHLLKWYDTCFQIDSKLALSYIEADYNRKIINPSFQDCDELTGQCKDPVEQYNSAFVNIEKFSGGALLLNIDDFGRRIHSPLTNIRSELRNLLTYNGLQLASVDINNSQPYLSTLLFNPSFWDITNTTYVLTHNSVGITLKEIFNSNSVTDYFIMICKIAISCVDSDVHTYTEIVKSGRFYEYMAEQTQTDMSDRSKLKAAIFQVLFTDNSYIGQTEAAPKRKFRDLFPDVYQLFSSIKRKEKANMPKLLQRIESHIILSIVTKRVAIEKPNLPIFTIHDSIVTIQGYEYYIERVMEEEMIKILGFPPKLTVSLWKPENLKFKNGEPYNVLKKVA